MKIIRGDKVYVQNIDLTNLLDAVSGLELSCPKEIFEQVFGEIFICNSNNQYQFREFNGKETVSFFESLDYIIDYDKLKDLSEDELLTVAEHICEERNNLARTYNNICENADEKSIGRLRTQVILKEYKLTSLRDLLWFKQGHIKMTLPDGIPYPEGYKGKKPGVLSRIFKKKN